MTQQSNTPKFQFKGTTETAKRTKIDWPLEVVAEQCALYLEGGRNAKELFAIAAERMEMDVSELPKSYSNANAASVHHGMRTRFLNAVNKESHPKHKEAIALAEQHGIIEPTAAEQADEAPEVESTES